MTYKTIQVSMDDNDLAEKRLKIAIDLASKVDSHLIGLHVIPPAFYPAYFSAEIPASMIEQQMAELKATAERAHARFDRLVANSGLQTEWRCVDQPYGDIATVMKELARYADLNVFGQNDPEVDDERSLDIAGTVLLGSGRPLLMVPYAGNFDNIGKKIIVAWNASRESTRAVFEVIPIMQTAETVEILAINSDETSEAGTPHPGADIAAALARHGINAIVKTTSADDVAIGNTLLNYASDDGADLLVMGAYGHSRLREMIFGGATRSILEHMTVPVFMSH
jgi:nucleotide-binding universal stress UspA family protein